MNLYICSTVRHLLFSLLRAAQEPDTAHHILFFTDYQQATLDNWSLDHLPENIHIHEVARANFRNQLQKSLRGRLLYFLAMRNLTVANYLKFELHNMLAIYCPTVAIDMPHNNQVHLWLFNERNKMSRLFRLLTKNFCIIEDGEGNYKLLPCAWWKWPARLLQGLPMQHRAFGEDRRCKAIWALYPDRLPAHVHGKGQRIDFLDSASARQLMANLFDDSLGLETDKPTVILATQPIDGLPSVTLNDKQRLYARIVKHLSEHGKQLILKIHPAEDKSDYAFIDSGAIRTPGKMPLEALILRFTTPVTIVSVSSSAGMGFENYCRRIKLVEGMYAETVPEWVAHPEKLDQVLLRLLADL